MKITLLSGWAFVCWGAGSDRLGGGVWSGGYDGDRLGRGEEGSSSGRPSAPSRPLGRGVSAALVECSATDFAPSPLTGSTSFPALEDWPLDGRDEPAGSSKENPVMRCGPRDSYAFIAGIYRCADGSNPLDGNVGAGGRRGAAMSAPTASATSSISTMCPARGAEQVYVDMYGCPEASKRAPSPSALRLNEELPAAVGKLMQEALDLSGDEKYTEAIAKVRDALAEADTTLDPDHPHRARLLDLLGSLQQESEQLDESESSLASAYRIWNSAGWPHRALGQPPASACRASMPRTSRPRWPPVSRRVAWPISATSRGPYDDRVIGSLYLLGELAQASGEQELAEAPATRRALAELSRGRRHPWW